MSAEVIEKVSMANIQHTAAFPPALRISIPHLAASGCVQATIPLVL